MTPKRQGRCSSISDLQRSYEQGGPMMRDSTKPDNYYEHRIFGTEYLAITFMNMKRG